MEPAVIAVIFYFIGLGVGVLGCRITAAKKNPPNSGKSGLVTGYVEHDIPDCEKDNVLSVLWQLLVEVESRTDKAKDPVGAHLVECAYNLVNRIGFTKERPRWERT